MTNGRKSTATVEEATAGTRTPQRRTQQERSAAMQKRLLDATIEALVEKGYGGTTTLEVQKRAGVSRGALLHHYGSRADLMVAAVDHLLHVRTAEVTALVASTPTLGPGARIDWAVRTLWSTFDGPLFKAALELWVAARNDPELLEVLLPQERLMGQAIRELGVDLFGVAAEKPEFADTLELVLDAMRGAAARSVLLAPAASDRLVASWTRCVRERLDT